ncbi:MAG: CopG family transcriptional regulator [Candidatus Hodarchaeota archaeon]
MAKETKKITVSANLYEKLQEKVVRTNFKSIDEYIEHILCQILQTEIEEDLTQEEEETIKERLRSLGYL